MIRVQESGINRFLGYLHKCIRRHHCEVLGSFGTPVTTNNFKWVLTHLHLQTYFHNKHLCFILFFKSALHAAVSEINFLSVWWALAECLAISIFPFKKHINNFCLLIVTQKCFTGNVTYNLEEWKRSNITKMTANCLLLHRTN